MTQLAFGEKPGKPYINYIKAPSSPENTVQIVRESNDDIEHQCWLETDYERIKNKLPELGDLFDFEPWNWTGFDDQDEVETKKQFFSPGTEYIEIDIESFIQFFKDYPECQEI